MSDFLIATLVLLEIALVFYLFGTFHFADLDIGVACEPFRPFVCDDRGRALFCFINDRLTRPVRRLRRSPGLSNELLGAGRKQGLHGGGT